MILSDLAKYSITRSIAQSPCNSWASCFILPGQTASFHILLHGLPATAGLLVSSSQDRLHPFISSFAVSLRQLGFLFHPSRTDCILSYPPLRSLCDSWVSCFILTGQTAFFHILLHGLPATAGLLVSSSQDRVHPSSYHRTMSFN